MATTNFSWATPTVGGSENTWGDTLNATLEAIDGEVANRQPLDAGLTSIAALTTAADRMIYTTASDTYAVATLTSAGRALIDDADASAQRTTLGLGTAAVEAYSSGTWSVTVSDNSANTSSTTATGRYYSIGDIVFCNFNGLSNISTAGLTGTDQLRISLPFTVKAAHVGTGAVLVSSMDAGTSSQNVIATATAGQNYARLQYQGGAALAATSMTVNDINASGVFDINFFSLVFLKA